MEKGRIKKWLDDRGFGFIQPDKGGEDLWFHRDSIVTWEQEPGDGALVEFERVFDQKKGKWQAKNVKLLGAPQEARSTPSPAAASATLPPECVFDSFYDAQTGEFKQDLFSGAAEMAARAFRAGGLKTAQFRQIFNALRTAAVPLREKRVSLGKARERFNTFYVERIVRAHARNEASKVILPDGVKEFFDKHKDLALSSREEMLGLFRYVTNILCYFGDKEESRKGRS